MESTTNRRELTFRAVVLGLGISAIISAMNIQMGLKTGFGEGGSILALVSAMLIMGVITRLIPGVTSFTQYENNISQTVASAAGSHSATLISVVSAYMMLVEAGKIDTPMTTSAMMFYLVTVSLMGMLFAVPLRRQYIEVEQLTFPSGTAGAKILESFYGFGAKVARRLQSRLLLGFGGVSAVVQTISDLGVYTWLAKLPVVGTAAVPFKVVGSPMLLGAGFLVGHRVGLSLLLGAIIAFMGFGPHLMAEGIIDTSDPKKIAKNIALWTMWPGTAAMVVAGFAAFGFRWKTIKRSFQSARAAVSESGRSEDMSMRTWIILTTVCTLAVCSVMWFGFGVPWWITCPLLVISAVLSMICARGLGETEFNPVGAATGLSQVAAGVVGPGSLTTNLTGGGMTSASAVIAADLLQDLKTGYLIGGNVRRQMIAQAIGIVLGVFIAVPMFQAVLASEPTGLGGEAFPAPAAVTKMAIAQAMIEGGAAFPAGVMPWLVVFGIIGLLLSYLETTKFAPYTPSPIGIGIGMIIGNPMLTVTITLGSVLAWILSKVWKTATFENRLMMGGAMLAGESLIHVGFIMVKAFAG